MLIALSACLAMLAGIYQLKSRGAAGQRRLAYGGLLIPVLAAYGLAGCAGGSSGGPAAVERVGRRRALIPLR